LAASRSRNGNKRGIPYPITDQGEKEVSIGGARKFLNEIKRDGFYNRTLSSP
jgi:hypothetical protein